MKLIFILLTVFSNEKWSTITRYHDLNVTKILDQLKKSSTGRRLIENGNSVAKKYGGKLEDFIKEGDASFVYVDYRTYDAFEKYDIKNYGRSIFLNRNLNLQEAVLDLSKILPDFINYKEFNLAATNFDLEDYILYKVEQLAESMTNECQIMQDLFSYTFRENNICKTILDGHNLTVQNTKEIIFRLGDYYNEFNDFLKLQKLDIKNLPLASSKEVVFRFPSDPYPIIQIRNYKDYIASINKSKDNQKDLQKTHRATSSLDEIWSTITDNLQSNIIRILEYLEKSSTGKKLLDKMKLRVKNNQNVELLDIIKEGDNSFCSVEYSYVKNQKKYEQSITLQRGISLQSIILTLAHELTHCSEDLIPLTFDYILDSKFSLEEFILNRINGKGGEVDAIINECYVLKDIFPSMLKNDSTCESIMVNGSYSSAKTTEYFFVFEDKHYNEFMKLVDHYDLDIKKFPSVEKSYRSRMLKPTGIPYVLDYIYEYQNAVKLMCKNPSKNTTKEWCEDNSI